MKKIGAPLLGLAKYIYYPVIIRPTRITTNSATIIDNIFINNIYLDCSSGILINDLLDHLPVFQILPNLNIQKPKKNSFKRRELTKANIDKLRNEIQNISWEYLKTINDVNMFNDYFVNVGPNLDKKITTNTNLSFKADYLKESFMDSMLLSPVCEQEIKRELENLDPSKTCGHIISCPG